MGEGGRWLILGHKLAHEWSWKASLEFPGSKFSLAWLLTFSGWVFVFRIRNFYGFLTRAKKQKKTNILTQNPSCLSGFYVQSKYQGILFVVYQSLGVDFQYFCYHYNKLRVISLSYEHGSGRNVFTNILQGFLSWFQEETVCIALKNRSSLLSASEAVTTPVMIAHHCIWVPGRATCRTKSAKISRTLVQITLVLI